MQSSNAGEKIEKLNETVHQLYIDLKKAHDSFRREVLYSILIESGVPMKLVMLNKMSELMGFWTLSSRCSRY
jgi:hypothetical protein